MKYILIFLLPFIALSNDYIHFELGIPKSSHELNQIERFEFASGFSCEHGVPLWVSYNLNKDWFGEVPRWSKNFMPDSLLDKECWTYHSD